MAPSTGFPRPGVPAAAAVRSSTGVPVSGHVIGVESAPVPRAVITLISLGGRQVSRMVAHPDGAYAVDAPGAGSYVLIASAEGYQPQASTVVVGGEPVSYDILLSATSGVVGTVRSTKSALDLANTGPLTLLTGYQTHAVLRRIGAKRLETWLRNRKVTPR